MYNTSYLLTFINFFTKLISLTLFDNLLFSMKYGKLYLKFLNIFSALDENSMNEVGESLPLPTSTSKESPKCVVCTVNERNALVMPCRHFLFCQPCIQQVQKSNTAHCPTCRGPISSIIEPFQRFSKIFPFTYILKTRMSHNCLNLFKKIYYIKAV